MSQTDPVGAGDDVDLTRRRQIPSGISPVERTRCPRVACRFGRSQNMSTFQSGATWKHIFDQMGIFRVFQVWKPPRHYSFGGLVALLTRGLARHRRGQSQLRSRQFSTGTLRIASNLCSSSLRVPDHRASLQNRLLLLSRSMYTNCGVAEIPTT